MTSTTPPKSRRHHDDSPGPRQRRAVRSTVPLRRAAIAHHPAAAVTAEQLHAHYADRPGTEPLFDAVIAQALGRAHRVQPEHRQVWARFLSVAHDHRENPRSAGVVAALANMVAVVAIDELEDYTTTDRLVAQVGERELARLQHRAGAMVEDDPDFPTETLVVLRLMAGDLTGRLARGPATASSAEDVFARCCSAARALIFEGVDVDRVGPPITSPEQLVEFNDRGSITDWRLHLGMVAAAPWGPYAQQLIEFARAANRPEALSSIEGIIEFCREWSKDHERDQIAREIKRLVALSGLSQREFAAWIGTSPSRLSTYVSGVVTPSAAMMLRIQRAVRTLRQQTAVPRLA